MRKFFLSKAATCGVILFILFINNVSHSKAQQAYFWSAQERIPVYENENNEQPPYLIADQNHTVHAFNSQPLVLSPSAALQENVSPKAIFYRQWTLQNGWTNPNDILFDSAGGNIELMGVSADQSGMVHLIFQMNRQDLFYTKALLSDANTATAWSIPLRIGEQSESVRPGIPNVGAIANEKSGNDIFVVYSGSQYGSGLYFTQSSDRGDNWSEPYPIYLTEDETLIVSDPKLYMGDSGILHAVWSTIKSGGFGGPAYYANLDLKSKTWSEKVELDTPGIQTPSVIENGGEVFTSYYRDDRNSIWWRRSSDGGNTWTYPSQISARHIGRNGAASFIVDSNKNLHIFWAERIDDDNHGMWHSIWTGTVWANPQAVVRGPRKIDIVGGNGFDPNSARAVISNGNVALVTWGTDGGAGQNGAWYSYKTLDAPELPGLPLPVPSVSPENNLPSDTLPLPTNIVGAEDESNPIAVTISPELLPSPQSPIIARILPVILLLVGVIVLRFLFYSRKK